MKLREARQLPYGCAGTQVLLPCLLSPTVLGIMMAWSVHQCLSQEITVSVTVTKWEKREKTVIWDVDSQEFIVAGVTKLSDRNLRRESEWVLSKEPVQSENRGQPEPMHVLWASDPHI